MPLKKIFLIIFIFLFFEYDYLFSSDRIMPLEENPHYFQYKGKPIYFTGLGTRSYISDINNDIETLYKNGGNLKLIKLFNPNHNLLPWQKTDKKYNLGVFNEAYWKRLRNYIKLCKKRGIIVDIEIWDEDLIENDWDIYPFNPDNNVSFGINEIPDKNGFYKTIPEKENRGLALRYQREFVKRILKETHLFPNIIYSLGDKDSTWNRYWKSFIKDFSKDLIIASSIDIRKQSIFPWLMDKFPQLEYSLEDDFDIIIFNRMDYLKKRYEKLYEIMNDNDNIKPIYSLNVSSTEELWMNFINGAAAVFINNDKGYNIIRNFRNFIKDIIFFKMSPHNELVKGDTSLLAHPKKDYIIYVKKGEKIELDLEDVKGKEITIRWYDPFNGKYLKDERIRGSSRKFSSPIDNFSILYIRRN